MAVRIFWSIVVGFFAGIFISSFLSLGWAFASVLVLVAVCVFFLSPEKTKERVTVVTVTLVAIAFGIARMHLAETKPDTSLNQYIGRDVTMVGVVFREPDVRENSTRLSVLVRTPDSEAPTGVLVVAPLHSDVAYGDAVRAKGTLRLPQAFETETGRIFNYPAFLKKDGITYELAFAHAEKTGENEGNRFVREILWIKQKYLSGLENALPEPSAALAGGITVGDKRALGRELSDVFRTTALIHIVVLSGYNIMIVINALSKVLLWAPQSVRYGVSGMVAISFVIMTGAAAPSVRAAAMAIIGMAGRATKRTYLAVRALALVALGMVLWNPYILAFDPGFQLSVAATWGIVTLTPIVLAWLSRLSRYPTLQEITATTVATQIAVLPLLLYQSGTLSIYALPANLLVLTALPAAMFFSALASIAGLFLGPLAPTIALPAHALLSYFVSIADFFARLPFASLPIGTFNFVLVVIAYATLLWYVRRKNSEPVATYNRGGA